MDIRLITPFINSTTSMIKEMTGIKVIDCSKPVAERSDLSSYGVASVITFAGKIKGRFVIDLEPALATRMISMLMGEENPALHDRIMLGCIAELNNIICGDANTVLNNQYSLGLRLAPPIVFTGTKAILATSKMESTTVNCRTAYGDFKLNIAFQGGVVE